MSIRKLLGLGLFLLACANLTAAQPSGRSGSRISIVPYEEVNGKLIVSVEAGGKTRRFLFDTGANVIISKSLCAELGLDTVKRVKTTDTGGQRRSHPQVRVKELSMGDFDFTDVAAIVVDDDNIFFKCLEIDGVIGGYVLFPLSVRVSAKEKTVTLSDDLSHWQPDKSRSQRMMILYGQPYVKLTGINGSNKATHWALFDTGATRYTCRDRDHFGSMQHKGVFTSVEESVGSTSIGLHGLEPETRQFRAVLPRLQLCGAVMDSVPVSSNQSGSSLIGTDLLKYGNAILDYRRGRFYFEPFAADTVWDKIAYANFSPMIIDGGIKVGTVWDEELAQRIAPGDTILSIDEQDCTAMDPCFLLTDSLKTKNGSLCRIKTKNGDIIEVKIVK